MAATLRVLVNKANVITKTLSSPLGGFAMFAKYSVYLYVDGKKKCKLKSSTQPQDVQIDSGTHVIQFTRKPLALEKGSIVAGNVVGGIFEDLAGGFLVSAVSEVATGGTREALNNATIEITANDGDVIDIEIQHTFRGYPIVVMK